MGLKKKFRRHYRKSSANLKLESKTTRRRLYSLSRKLPHNSLDEVALSQGELYTVLTSKQAKGRKGSIVAIIKGTKSDETIDKLLKIDRKLRLKVKEITLDMAGSMKLVAKRCFPNAMQVIDRFHVQKLATEAVQEIRIKHRWEAIDSENEILKQAKEKKKTRNQVFSNGDTRKQLLAKKPLFSLQKQRKMDGKSKYKSRNCLSRIPGFGSSLQLIG